MYYSFYLPLKSIIVILVIVVLYRFILLLFTAFKSRVRRRVTLRLYSFANIRLIRLNLDPLLISILNSLGEPILALTINN